MKFELVQNFFGEMLLGVNLDGSGISSTNDNLSYFITDDLNVIISDEDGNTITLKPEKITVNILKRKSDVDIAIINDELEIIHETTIKNSNC